MGLAWVGLGLVGFWEQDEYELLLGGLPTGTTYFWDEL